MLSYRSGEPAKGDGQHQKPRYSEKEKGLQQEHLFSTAAATPFCPDCRYRLWKIWHIVNLKLPQSVTRTQTENLCQPLPAEKTVHGIDDLHKDGLTLTAGDAKPVNGTGSNDRAGGSLAVVDWWGLRGLKEAQGNTFEERQRTAIDRIAGSNQRINLSG